CGDNCASASPFTDAQLQAKTWRELDVGSRKPPKRSSHAAVYDPQGKAMVIFGGPALGAATAFAPGLSFSFSSQPRLLYNDDGGRSPGLDCWKSAFFAAHFLPLLGVLVSGPVHGPSFGDGCAFASPFTDAQLQAKTWRELDVGSTKPPKRSSHTAIYDPQGKAMVIFGGAALGVPPRPTSLLAFLSPSARSPGYNDDGGRGPGLDCWKSALLCCLLAGCCWASWSPDPCTDQDRFDDTWALDLAVRGPSQSWFRASEPGVPESHAEARESPSRSSERSERKAQLRCAL
ncbi:unnamed protein product, partial [Symbiodinium sp. KB8]